MPRASRVAADARVMRRSIRRTTPRSSAALARVSTPRTATRYPISQAAGILADRWARESKSRYHVAMSMRRHTIALTIALPLAGLAAAARADTFSGFSGVDRPYLVNQDRVCQPIAVAGNTAAGAPRCEKAAADVIAKLSIKPPMVQSGAKASFTAQAAGRTITVSRKTGGAIVAWDAPDPVLRIVELYASQYEDRVAVAYAVRRAGREVTDVVAFDLGQSQTAIRDPAPPGAGSDATTTAPTPPGSATPPVPPGPTSATDAPPSPQLAKAIADARAAARNKAIAAWKAVLVIDAAN